MTSNYKLPFKEHAKWALYGVFGAFVPAVTSLSFPNAYVILLSTILSLVVGISVGRDIEREVSRKDADE